MKKFIGLYICFYSLFAHAQIATFTLDSLKGELNGKEIVFPKIKIQKDISDTSGTIILGKDSDNEKFGVRFSLTKFTTAKGSHYVPQIEFVFIEKDNIEQHIPVMQDYNDYTLTADENTAKMNHMKESFSLPPSRYSVSYSFLIDGSKLNYTDVKPKNKKSEVVMFKIKRLSVDKKIALKNKKFRLSETDTAQVLNIGTYNNQPVTLTYELMKGKTGNIENFYFKSSLHYMDKGGNSIETKFFTATFLKKHNSGIYIYPNHSILNCNYTLRVED